MIVCVCVPAVATLKWMSQNNLRPTRFSSFTSMRIKCLFFLLKKINLNLFFTVKHLNVFFSLTNCYQKVPDVQDWQQKLNLSLSPTSLTDSWCETVSRLLVCPLYHFSHMLYNNDKPLLLFHHSATIFTVIINLSYSFPPFQLESGEEVEVEEFYVKFKGLYVVARVFFSALYLFCLSQQGFLFF